MFASYIVGAARTPRGRGKRDKGALAGIHPQELFAQTLTTLQDRVGFEPREVDDVIAGCVSQVGEQGSKVARNAVLAAGWPYEISAVSLNRFCASGTTSNSLWRHGCRLRRDGFRDCRRCRKHVAYSHGL
jgi:acetyl-CoA C-acetyltransferase